MIEFLAQSATAPFTIALLLMVLLGLVEAIGLGSSAVDLDAAEIGGALDWLNVGRLPLLMLIVVFLTAFGLVGLVLQSLAISLAGGVLPWFAAIPAAVLAAAPATRWLGTGLSRVLPRDETTAVDIDSLVGRRARVVVGIARRGYPARARVEDAHGHIHHVMVEPNDDASFTDAAMLLLTARHGDTFHAVELPPDIFSIMRPTP